jgi:vancomycin resistance protein YoaR
MLNERSSESSAFPDPWDRRVARVPRGTRRPPHRRRSVRVAVAFITVPISAVLCGYLAWAAVRSDELPPGTRVAGVDVGGMAPAAAEETLRRELTDEAARPVAVVVAGRPLTIKPADSGLAFDARATVAAADRGFPSPVEFAGALFGKRPDVAPRVRVDGAKLSSAVAGVAGKVDRPKRESVIGYEGLRPVLSEPRTGRVLDRAAAAQAIRAAFLRPRGSVRAPVPLPMRPDTPTTSPAQVRRVAGTTARSAVAAPLVLTRDSRSAVLPPQTIARNLRFVADGRGGMRMRFGAAAAIKGTEKRFIDSAEAPKDASVSIVNGKPKVIPARTGQGIDTAALARAAPGVLATAGEHRVPVHIKITAPRVTTEQVKAYRITEKISAFTTKHPCCAPRVTNIHRIADLVDGEIIKPGETFSLNTLVGRRDTARGFVQAPMILNGRYVNDVGGGVSQFATTMFNAVFFGGLHDVQHTPHEFYISRYPAGRESTVSFPQPDFRWLNDSRYGVLITTEYTDTSVTVAFWSTKRYDISATASDPYNVRTFKTVRGSGRKCIDMPGAKGFTIDVWRVFRRDGRVVRRQKYHTVYQPEPRLICERRPAS